MGKKTKIGKQRKDKYYQLAKETVCIDLCAAPGGWMQVAHQNMPVSSVVIGVDLFPIKQVPGCIALTEDITTDKCKTAIKKEIKTWKADVVLHDGAPNVGLNWIHDAYQQASLTLSAVKLATHFLREGGWFVTKVFRSKDYHALLWVLKQFFKKVHATKPQASRNESSEIFVVCQGYIAPDTIDPKFLDAKHVFEDLDIIVIDDKSIEEHPKTTAEIVECCQDIKVLGRKDLKALLSWLKQMKDWKGPQKKTEDKAEEEEAAQKDETEEADDEEDVDSKIAELQDEERRSTKRKRKQLNKQRQKLAEKMNLKMVLKGDGGPIMESNDMFSLSDIKNAEELSRIIDQAPDLVANPDEDSDDELKVKQKYVKYDVEASKLDSSGLYYKDSDNDDSKKKKRKIDKITEQNTMRNSKLSKTPTIPKDNPLLTDLDNTDPASRRSMKAELWFQKDCFKDIDEEDDEGVDLDKLVETYAEKDLKRLKKNLKMDAETLALGTMIATSKKFKRDLIDDAWNRYAHVLTCAFYSQNYTDEYKNRLQDINARPIKKVIEAKARKKKRMVKKMERAKKKVEAVMENADMSEREKAQQVRHLYKKAQADPKKKITYVVAKKHTSAKRMKRPNGVKGQYKVVDPRMKKDLRAAKAKEKTKGRGKKGKVSKGKANTKQKTPPKKKGLKVK
ncbi:putative rRNA methyltransferase 3 [Operophtera brumata]|uniref:Putative rRNA methyltransferase 3 n=1 Tax=Operophtera brumata TaxID=104452 RepID=A0A0L7LVH3_OPEBR|nr:putative rRNA methyltransferase 3 [Operophtera brumata]